VKRTVDLEDVNEQAKIVQISMRGRLYTTEDDGELYEIVPAVPATTYMEPAPERDNDNLFVYMWGSRREPQTKCVVTVRNVLTNTRRRITTRELIVWDKLNTTGCDTPKTDHEARQYVLTWYHDYGTPEEQEWARGALLAHIASPPPPAAGFQYGGAFPGWSSAIYYDEHTTSTGDDECDDDEDDD